jgi:hypothetical protein
MYAGRQHAAQHAVWPDSGGCLTRERSTQPAGHARSDAGRERARPRPQVREREELGEFASLEHVAEAEAAARARAEAAELLAAGAARAEQLGAARAELAAARAELRQREAEARGPTARLRVERCPEAPGARARRGCRRGRVGAVCTCGCRPRTGSGSGTGGAR